MNDMFKRAIEGGASDIHMDLVSAGQITFEVGKAAANSPSDFDLKMDILGGPGSGHAGGVPGGGDSNSGMFGS